MRFPTKQSKIVYQMRFAWSVLFWMYSLVLPTLLVFAITEPYSTLYLFQSSVLYGFYQQVYFSLGCFLDLLLFVLWWSRKDDINIYLCLFFWTIIGLPVVACGIILPVNVLFWPLYIHWAIHLLSMFFI